MKFLSNPHRKSPCFSYGELSKDMGAWFTWDVLYGRDEKGIMEIRKMSIDDYEEIFGLWMSTPGIGLNEIDDSKSGINKYLKRNPNTCFVAIVSGKIAGVILSSHDGRRGFIYHTAVASAYRNRGIGSLLVGNALKAMEAEGIHKVALVVYNMNEVGNKFWEDQGFSVRKDLIYRDKALTELKVLDITNGKRT